MTNNITGTKLSAITIKLLKVRAYVDTVRRAAEHQAQESGQWFGFVEPCEDAVLLVDEIESDLDQLRGEADRDS